MAARSFCWVVAADSRLAGGGCQRLRAGRWLRANDFRAGIFVAPPFGGDGGQHLGVVELDGPAGGPGPQDGARVFALESASGSPAGVFGFGDGDGERRVGFSVGAGDDDGAALGGVGGEDEVPAVAEQQDAVSLGVGVDEPADYREQLVVGAGVQAEVVGDPGGQLERPPVDLAVRFAFFAPGAADGDRRLADLGDGPADGPVAGVNLDVTHLAGPAGGRPRAAGTARRGSGTSPRAQPRMSCVGVFAPGDALGGEHLEQQHHDRVRHKTGAIYLVLCLGEQTAELEVSSAHR